MADEVGTGTMDAPDAMPGHRGRPAQRRFAAGAWLCGVGLALAGAGEAAEPPPLALVIGEAGYAGLPPLPGCIVSAHAVAQVLGHAGFAVTERHDLSNGETDGALADFTTRLAGPPAAAGVIYVCAYGTGYGGRAFLLPVSARLQRETDVLTQGLLATALPRALGRAAAAGGLVLVDVVSVPPARPDAPAATAPPGAGLEALTTGGAAPGIGVVAALQDGGQAETPLAQILSAAVVPPTVETGAAIAAIEGALASTAGLKLWVHLPPGQSFLAGGPPPPAPPAAPAPVAVTPPPAVPAPPPAPPQQPAPVAAEPPPSAVATPPPAAATPLPPPLPPEEAMTEDDRRRVQRALVALGYYPGPVDGLFGPDTRAAIRRFQHEIGTAMTGRLAGDEGQRLLATGR